MSNYHLPDVSTRSVLQTILRHKKKIVFWPLFVVALGTLVLVYFPRAYRSEARLFLRVGRESVGLDPTATTGQTIPLQQGDRNDEVKSALEVLRSRQLIAQAVDQVGVDVVLGRAASDQPRPNALADALNKPIAAIQRLVKSLDPISEREEAIVRVERHLNVGSERDSTVIFVEYEAQTPQLAQAVCNALVDVYRREHMRIYRNQESRPFFAEQQRRLRQQLDDALVAVQHAKDDMGLSTIDERRATLEAQFSAVELDRLATQQQLATAEARIADLDRQLARVPERLVASQKSVPNQGADLLRDQLYTLQVKLMDLQSRYSDVHPLVQSANEQLNEAKQVLAEQSAQRMETTDNVNPIHRDLSLDLKREIAVVAGCKARLVQLAQQKETVLADLRAINAYDLKIDQLTRQADLARGKFFQYAENMEEARIDKELENEKISNVSIVQSATLAEKPVSPSKPLVALATFILATAGTGALVLASERSHERWQTIGDDDNGAAIPVQRGSRVHHRALSLKANGKKESPRLPR